MFPLLPGSHIKFTNPALEFVKSLCKVLSLDPAITDQVNKLRRNLLKLINVGEFSDSADWKDPCISFVLPEVICKQCNHCRDIDLCKDAYVSHTETTAGTVSNWLCASGDCRAPYETGLVTQYIFFCWLFHHLSLLELFEASCIQIMPHNVRMC